MTIKTVAASAPPLDNDEERPVVMASAVPMSSSVPPQPTTIPASCPPGMIAKTTTTTYSDGRVVQETTYQPASSVTATVQPTQQPTAASSYHPPRRDLGSRPVNVTCPYCSQTGKTRTNYNCGDCTLISVLILLLCFFPLFWIPFICPSCQDVEHHCSNCGRLVGKSRAECCA